MRPARRVDQGGAWANARSKGPAMATVSIVIPAYNIEDEIGRTLESAARQTLEDVEIVVVDDGSTDGTADVIDAFAERDDRCVVVRQANGGLHRARKAGVAAATGDYLVFLDGGDELEPDVLRRIAARMEGGPVDILHFGTRVVAVGNASEEARAGFEDFANRDGGSLRGMEILRASCDEGIGYLLDWRVWQRIYTMSLAKRAFSEMTDARLERAEDSYEWFVLARNARTFDTLDTCRGHIYYFGEGVSGFTALDAERYRTFCEQFKACYDAACAYVGETPSPAEAACLAGMRHKLQEILANDWLDRVEAGEREAAYQALVETWGGAIACREMLRFVRDRAYAYAMRREMPATDDDLYAWVALAEATDVSDGDADAMARLATTRREAGGLVDAFERRRAYQKESVRVFVTTHQSSIAIPDDPIFQPVQVGPALKDPGARAHWMLHDDDGEDISDKNPSYCEMTVQYWAWKNVDAEWYGFCHYRRYFNFAGATFDENDWGEVEGGRLDDEAMARYGLDRASVERCLEGCDILYTEVKDVAQFPDHNRSMREHYANATHLFVKDLDLLVDVIGDVAPDYAEDTATYLAGSRSAFCNMYLMRHDVFHAYCAWVFPIMGEFERRCDMTRYSDQALRTTGHLAERLFNIYLLHHKRTAERPWRERQLQCVRFSAVDPLVPLVPAFGPQGIPVVFAASDNYSPMLATAILSTVVNTNPDDRYDIIVLHRDISAENQRRMRDMVRDHANVSLRFYDVSRLVKNYKLEANAHISTETYYRFLIQWILPEYEKVLYLDSDLVVDADVAELYRTELGDDLIAAIYDVDYLGNLNLEDGERLAYSVDELGMSDPYSYFQAGVLLLNVQGMAKLHTLEEWLKLAGVPHLYNDQDVLNMECEGRVTYVDFSWNVLMDSGRVEAAIQFAPAEMKHAYFESRNHPKIIHFAGWIKPWNDPTCDFADEFWKYLRMTPYYEEMVRRHTLELVRRHTLELIRAQADFFYDDFIIRQGERSLGRKVADVVTPYGSRRREMAKHLAASGISSVRSLLGHGGAAGVGDGDAAGTDATAAAETDAEAGTEEAADDEA